MASVAAVRAEPALYSYYRQSAPDEAYRMATHKFLVGEKVHLRAGQGVRFATAEVFEIVQQLPERDGEHQYKIKSLDEPHQRVAKEGQLRRM
jgi:hypothetical protein